jgi:hypothetical protein
MSARAEPDPAAASERQSARQSEAGTAERAGPRRVGPGLEREEREEARVELSRRERSEAVVRVEAERPGDEVDGEERQARRAARAAFCEGPREQARAEPAARARRHDPQLVEVQVGAPVAREREAHQRAERWVVGDPEEPLREAALELVSGSR